MRARSDQNGWPALRCRLPAGWCGCRRCWPGLFAGTTRAPWGSPYTFRFEQIPGPLKVGEALINQLQHIAFYLHIGASLRRIAISYSLAAGIGITLGLLMGRSRFIRDLIFPYVEILRPIPGVAWIPLAILLWPTEEGSIIYITFLGALFPVILN